MLRARLLSSASAALRYGSVLAKLLQRARRREVLLSSRHACACIQLNRRALQTNQGVWPQLRVFAVRFSWMKGHLAGLENVIPATAQRTRFVHRRLAAYRVRYIEAAMLQFLPTQCFRGLRGSFCAEPFAARRAPEQDAARGV